LNLKNKCGPNIYTFAKWRIPCNGGKGKDKIEKNNINVLVVNHKPCISYDTINIIKREYVSARKNKDGVHLFISLLLK